MRARKVSNNFVEFHLYSPFLLEDSSCDSGKIILPTHYVVNMKNVSYTINKNHICWIK